MHAKSTWSVCSILLLACVLIATASRTAAAQTPLFQTGFYALDASFGGEHGLAEGDINGDGNADLVFAGTRGGYCYNQVGALLGNGNGTFQRPTCYDPGSNDANAVALADMNGDGKLDLVTSGSCNTANSCATGEVGVLLGRGDGTFQAVIASTAGIQGGGLGALVTGDVNSDGRPDVVAINGASDNILVLLGNGDGTLQTAQSYNPPYVQNGPSTMSGGILTGLVLADLNVDGNPDIVLSSRCLASNDCSNGAVGWLLGSRSGTFQSSNSSVLLTENTVHTGAVATNAMVVADVNADGTLDVVTANTAGSNGVVSVLQGVGGGVAGNAGFLPAQLYASGGLDGLGVAVADMNADGIVDVLAFSSQCPGCPNSSSVGVLLGSSSGMFQEPPLTYTSATYGGGPMLLGDVNSDGKPDVVVNVNQVFVLLGTIGSKASTSTMVSVSSSSVRAGQAATLTAIVQGDVGGPVNAGPVRFMAGSVVLGSSFVASGRATLITSSLTPGSYSITAQYGGDPIHGTSTSSPAALTVTAPLAPIPEWGVGALAAALLWLGGRASGRRRHRWCPRQAN